MNNDPRIDERMRHAYVDGRLSTEEQKTKAIYLAAHPQEARKLDAWRKDAAQLQAAWQTAGPPLNPALDPAVIRMRLKERATMRWQLAASILVALGIGGLSGWQLNAGPTSPASLAARPLPMQDADRKSTRLNSSHVKISYAVFCLKKKRNHVKTYI